MKIDTQFIDKLLPSIDNKYSWLLVVMNRWVKMYPETVRAIVEMSDKKKFNLKLCGIHAQVFFWIAAISLILSPVYPLLLVCTGIGLVFGATIYVALTKTESSQILPVQKNIETKRLQQLLDTIDTIVRSERNGEKILLVEQWYENASFELLRTICEENAFTLAGQVLRGEQIVSVQHDDVTVAEETNNTRRKLNDLHWTLSSVGLLNPDLGKYYGKEISTCE